MEIVREKISLCVELLDAFSNKTVVDKNVFITVNGYRPILYKEGKYYIFRLPQNSVMVVNIISMHYETKCLPIDVGKVEVDTVIDLLPDGWLTYMYQIPVLTILLQPSSSYPLKQGIVRKEFFGVPYEMIPVVKNKNCFFLLSEDYQGGDWIVFSMPEQKNSMCLQIGDTKEKENFLVIGKDGQYNCRLASPLQSNYLKGSRIYEIYYVKADASGKAIGIQFV